MNSWTRHPKWQALNVFHSRFDFARLATRFSDPFCKPSIGPLAYTPLKVLKRPTEHTPFFSKKVIKGNPPFYYGGGGKNGGIFLTSKCKILGLECRRKFKLVLAHIMDPSGPFGARTPPKSMCTHVAHPLEKKWSKMAIFGTTWRRMCLVSANHVGRACTPGMCQARSEAKNDGISAFLAPLER